MLIALLCAALVSSVIAALISRGMSRILVDADERVQAGRLYSEGKQRREGLVAASTGKLHPVDALSILDEAKGLGHALLDLR